MSRGDSDAGGCGVQERENVGSAPRNSRLKLPVPRKPQHRSIPPPPPELQLPPAERIHVDPNTLALSDFLIRDTIDPDQLEDLIQSIRTAGFGGAATGMRRADGTIVLTTGKRLWLAAKRLGCTLPMDVRSEGPLVPVVEALLAQSHSVSLNAFEEGRLYRNSLRAMSRVLGYDVTQVMLAEWLGINQAIVSQCLRIVRKLTPELAKQAGIEFNVLKTKSRRALYGVAKIRDLATRADHLVHLVTGSWPAGSAQEHQRTDAPPFTRRNYGVRKTYSIPDPSQITDSQLDELISVVRIDVAIARRAATAEVAA